MGWLSFRDGAGRSPSYDVRSTHRFVGGEDRVAQEPGELHRLRSEALSGTCDPHNRAVSAPLRALEDPSTREKITVERNIVKCDSTTRRPPTS